MRRIALSAASVLIGALAVCFTASHATQASAPAAQQHVLATEASTGTVVEPRDNHGND
ncbi:hypothetical protein ABZ946_06765 [Streptomyces sp. NPDC046324]|uniref:hypothetical protein n=1 Tax=Streptomyces sp. NPDC046324 TaxID=3154915 RepID=UPI0033E8ED73